MSLMQYKCKQEFAMHLFLHAYEFKFLSTVGNNRKITLAHYLTASNSFQWLAFPKSVQCKFSFTFGYLVKVEVCMDVSRYPAMPAILIACAGVRGQRARFSFHTPHRTAGSVGVCTRAALRIQP